MATFLERVEADLGMPAEEYLLAHPVECQRELGMTPQQFLAEMGVAPAKLI